MIIAILLSLVASQALADTNGLTPLMRAAARGDAAQVTTLVAAGADVNLAHAEVRLTPVMFAAYFGHDAVVQLLLEKGARANAKDGAGASAVDWAAQGGHQAVAARLTKAGGQLNPFLNVGALPFGLMDLAAGKAP